MHYYGEDFDFNAIEDAAYYIGWWLARWGRVSVHQCKEKFGTVRVYCYFGLDSFYGIWRPRHMWVPTWWPWKLDLAISCHIMPVLNKIVVPIQEKLYRFRYAQAVKKWPHLRDEILVDADHLNLVDGIAGFKASDHWTTVEEEINQ